MPTQEQQSLRHSLALKGAKSGLWDWNIPENTIYFDPNYFQLAGYAVDEFPHHYDEWKKRVHPDDVAVVEEALQQYLSGERETFAVEFRFKRKSADWMWILAQGEITEWDEDSNPVRIIGLHIDITETKNIELALQKERAFSTNLIKTAQLIILVMDIEGRIQRINPYMEAITGYKEAEVKGKDWFNTFLPPADHTMIRAMFKKAIGDIDVSGEANPIVAKDGRELMIEWHSKTLKDTDGVVVGLLSFGVDIRERKQAEFALKKAANEWQAGMDVIDDAICLLDNNRYITRANTEFYSMMGSAPEQVIGHHIVEIMHSDGNDDHCPVCMAQKEKRDFLMTIEADDENNAVGRPLEIMVKIIRNEDDASTGILMKFHDLTESRYTEQKLRQSEEKHRALFENAPFPYHSLDADGCIIDVNLNWMEALGYSADEISGQWYGDFLASEDKKIFADNFPILKSSGHVHDVPFRVRHKKGHYLDILLEGCSAYTSDGDFIQTYCIFQDVSEKNRAQEELRKSERKFRLLANFTQDWDYWINPEGQYVYISPSCEKISGYRPEEFMSNPNLLFDITKSDYVSRIHQHFEDENLSKTKEFSIELQITAKNGETRWLEHNCIPIFDENGNFAGRRGNNRDITDRKQQTKILNSTISLRQFSDDHSIDELLQKSLDEVEKITGSSIGFLHFVEPDQETLSLQAWSTNTLENMCKALGSKAHYPVSEAGVWVDCVHQRRTTIHNDYLSLPERKGLPEGHAPVVRELVVPVFRDKKIVAILGVGNKSIDYTQKDAERVEEFADTVWDIAQRKQAENALLLSERKFSRLFNLNPDAISLTRVTDGTYVDINSGFSRMSGWQEKEIIGRSSLDLGLWHREEDRDRVVSDLQAYGEIDGLEVLFQRKDGRVSPGFFSARLIEISGENCILSITRDITEQKRIEREIIKAKEEWEATFDAMTDMVTIHDKNMIIVRANKTAHDLLGFDYGTLNGKKCCEILWGSAETCLGCPLLTTIATGQKCSETLSYNNPDRTLQVTTAPIPAKDGQPEYFVHVARDITDQQRLEREVSRANRLASLGELAAGVAHEINNPNALILYNSDILDAVIKDLLLFMEENPPADTGRLFGGLTYQDVTQDIPLLLPTIHDSAQRIKRIVNDLRDFSRQDSSDIDKTIEVNSVVHAAVRLVGNTIKKATDHFTLNLAESLPVVAGVAGRLEQVVINLLLNACQALENHSQEISISTVYDAALKQVQIIVTDAGPGMTADVLEHILEPFVTSKRARGGTGLGLSVSARIIKDHHGTIKFESTPGVGTTATICLPVGKEDDYAS